MFGYFIGNAVPISGFSGLGSNTGTQSGGNQQPTSFAIPSYVPFKGSESAGINIIEFGDYQCPFCERFFQDAEQQITSNYIDTGKAKFYFMDFAFLGPDSLTLAEGAWCANEQGLYYEYHDYVYENQGIENSGWATPEKVKAFVPNIPGLNVQSFSTCLDSGKYQSRVQELTTLGQSVGVSGTPTLLIGSDSKGYVTIVGAQPFAVFQQAIDQILA